MQRYLKTIEGIFSIILAVSTGTHLLPAQEVKQRTETKLYTGKYTPFTWIGDDFGFLKLDPGLRYIMNIDGDRVVRIWRLESQLSSGRIVYDRSRLRGHENYDPVFATQTSDGFVLLADYPEPAEGEMGRRVIVWDFKSASIKPLSWGTNLAKVLIGNPERTELSSFASVSSMRDQADLWSLDGKLLGSIKADKIGPMAGYPLMDKQDSMYVFEKKQTGAANQPLSKSVLINIGFPDKLVGVITNETDFLFPDLQPDASAWKAMPILLDDGITLAVYATGKNSDNPGRIEYFRGSKLVKSANDPVPKGTDEARLAITGDGRGVVAQTVSGENKGRIGVWDIETHQYSEIATMHTIRLVFPWVQGKYAPIWSSQNGNAYEAGLLEITRVAESDK